MPCLAVMKSPAHLSSRNIQSITVPIQTFLDKFLSTRSKAAPIHFWLSKRCSFLYHLFYHIYYSKIELEKCMCLGHTGLIHPVTYHCTGNSLNTYITTGPHYQPHTNTTSYNVLTSPVVFTSMYLVFISLSTVATLPSIAANSS